MEFKELCEWFESIKRTKDNAEKARILQNHFTTCRQILSKEAIFSVLRLFLPQLDRERATYNMKEPKIARVLIKLLALPVGNDKKVLAHSHLMSGQASDFSEVVYSVIRKYLSKTKTILTVDELNSSLDHLSARTNETEAEDIIMKLFKKCSPEDSRWIIRIILKDLKMGISHNRILNCYHKDAKTYYDSNSNLKKVTEVLYNKYVNAHELDIQVFEAFRPMLSKRVDAAIFKKFLVEDKLYYIENKFDGERFQLHMNNGSFKYFSRNGFDYSNEYGTSFDNGILTPKLTEVFQPFVQQIILDGEMMLWNKEAGRFGSKGMSFDVKKLRESGKYQPCFCVYDLILLNNDVLTNRCLRHRVELLKRAVRQEIIGTFILSIIKEVNTRQEIIAELNRAVGHEEEGIIVKDPESIYQYSDRNSGWFKMKLEYFEDTMHDLDVILMGGQFASSTSDQLNSFIVGVRSGTTENGKPIFLAFGKVSSGLKDIELDKLNEKLKTEGRIFDGKHSNSLVFGKETPNYYIEPKHSLIFVVRATELTRTTDSSYKTSYSLRFPRVMQIRSDKPVDECLDMNELLELTNKNKAVIKLNKRSIELEEILQTKPKIKKKKVIEVANFEDTTQKCDLLEGYMFHVLNGYEEKGKDEIEALIRRAGGNVLYKTDDTVDIVLVGVYNEKAQKVSSKRNHFDVIDFKWLQRVIREGELFAYETTEIYCLGNNINNCLSEEVDRYGDSYTQDPTIDSLKHCFGIISNLNEQPCFEPMFNPTLFGKSYHQYFAYFDKYEVFNDPTSTVIYNSLGDELEFRYYRGNVCSVITEKTNLILIKSPDRKEVLKQHLKSIDRSDIEIKDVQFIYEE